MTCIALPIIIKRREFLIEPRPFFHVDLKRGVAEVRSSAESLR